MRLKSLPASSTSLSAVPHKLDVSQCSTWKDAIATAIPLLAPNPTSPPQLEAEILLVRKAQMDSFPSDLSALQTDKDLSSASKLSSLAPELDQVLVVIRVGGRLRRAEDLDPDTIHPIVLDSSHRIAKLLIQKYE